MDQEATSPEANLFSDIDQVEESSLKPIEESQRRPLRGDSKWSDFVLSQLTKDEMISKEDDKGNKKTFPKTDGLYRLVSVLVGKILKGAASATHYLPITERDFLAVASYDLVVRDLDGDLQEYTAVGEGSIYNADKPFSKFPASIASTRAKGRACKDCLGIKVCTAEELSETAEKDDDLIDNEQLTNLQKTLIEKRCKTLNIDLMKFINLGSKQYNNLSNVARGKATEMLGILEGYDKRTIVIPTKIKLPD